MKFTEDEVFQILKLLEESDFEELHLEMGDLKLHVRKKMGAERTNEECVAVGSTQAEVPLNTLTETKDVIKNKAKHTPSIAPEVYEKVTEKKVELTTQEGLLSITAPMLGTFYRRPSPGEPPYVEVGSFVKEDDTVCLLEVMKVFNSVKAGVRGYIVRICAESGELVEYGQTLFLVKPADKLEEKN